MEGLVTAMLKERQDLKRLGTGAQEGDEFWVTERGQEAAV
jgi:hypothetical protein